MADIFISYARADRRRIAALGEALEGAGFSVWWDRSIAGGAEFPKEIERELNAAHAVIVAWSASGNESPWVRDEAALARDGHKLIPISLDGKMPPMGFRQFHALNFSSPNEAVCTEAFGKLVESVKLRLNASAQSRVDILEKAAGKIEHVELPSARAVATALRRLSRQNIPWRNIIVAAALIVFLGSALVWRQTTTPPAQIATIDPVEMLPQSVAVLPFRNLSSDPEQIYFSDGVTGEISNALAQVRDLHVAAQSSSFQFREENRDAREVARQLRVAAIVEGSVQKLGDHVRVTAQLVDVRSNRVVWSQAFDGELKDLFAVQNAVAIEIVGVMKENFDLPETSIAPARHDNVPTEAYDLYLQAKKHLRDLLAAGASAPRWEGIVPAYDLLTEAIEMAPDFALAYASRGEAIYWISWIHGTGTASTMLNFESPFPFEEARDRADADIEMALELGPELAAAHISFRFHSSNDSSEAGMQEISEHVDAALQINPNHAKARDLRSQILRETGHFRESFEEAQRAYELDPLNTDVAESMVQQYFYLGDFKKLDPFLSNAISWSNDGHLFAATAFIYAEYGKFEKLIELELQGAKLPADPGTGWGVFDKWFGTLWSFGASYATLDIPEMARLRTRGQYDDIFLILDGRYQDAVDYLEAEWAIRIDEEKFKELRQPEWRYRLFDIHRGLAFAYLFTAEQDKIIELSQQSQQFDLQPEPPKLPYTADLGGPWIETSYAYALYQTGDENADAWMKEYLPALENLLAQGIAIPNYEYEYARALTILGRNDEAFASLERAIDKGWRRWYFDVDPITAPLREMPEFEGLKARYDADITRMRKVVVEGLREQEFEIAE